MALQGTVGSSGVGWGWGTRQVLVSHLGICPEHHTARARGGCRGTAALCPWCVLSAGVLRALRMWPFTSLRLGCVCRQSFPPSSGLCRGMSLSLPKSLLIPPVPPAHPVD